MAAANRMPVGMWEPTMPRNQPAHVLAIFFLCPLDETQVAEICQRISDGADNEPSNVRVSPIIPIPWTLASTPPLSVILKLDHYHAHVFVDEQGVRDGTAIVRSSFHRDGERPAVARVELERVNRIATALRREKPLSKFVSEDAMIQIESPQSIGEQVAGYEIVYTLPNHLPRDLELKLSTLTIISLVHLSEEEINHIQSSIGTTEEITSVVIHNWPNPNEPCTRSELYSIFQAIKPNVDAEVDETFVLFLDKNWKAVDRNTVNEDNRYRILCAHQISDDSNQRHYQNTIDVFSLNDLERAPLDLWHMIWHPFEAGRKCTVNGARINCHLDFRVRNGTFNKGPCTDIIVNPENLVVGPSGPIVFILDSAISSNARNLRAVRDYLSEEFEDPVVFYDVSQYLETADVRGLMAFMESERFLATNEEPPNMFMAVDQATLKMVGGSKEPNEEDDREEDDESDEAGPIIFGSQSPLCLDFKDDEDKAWAYQYLGYAYGRLEAEEAWSTWNNLEVANMFFWECVPIDDWIYWSSCRSWVKEHFGETELEDNIFQPSFEVYYDDMYMPRENEE